MQASQSAAAPDRAGEAIASGQFKLHGCPLNRKRIHMRALLPLAFALLLHALPAAAGEAASAALVRAAALGPEPQIHLSIPDSNETIMGVVLAGERGKLLLMRKQASGQYSLEAASAVFENNFGPRYYIEIIQASGARRFSIQVNAHSACGIQVETFRMAQVNGTWRVAGYDKAEPDSETCDVNLRSREYSANLLTHQVNIVRYRKGKVVKRESRMTSTPAPDLATFRFDLFQSEP
jgi:hypothetical protein